MRLRRGLITKASPASVLRTLANPSNRCAVSEPVSETPASVRRTLANPYWGRLNERLPCVRGGGPRSGGRVVKEQSLTACGGAEPLSARPASVLRTLANLSHKRGLVKINRAAGAPLLFDFLSSFFSPRSGLFFAIYNK